MVESTVSIRRYEREREARRKAELLLEQRNLALYETNQQLRRQAGNLEKQIEERTKALCIARDAAQSASRVKSEFLATMSHEIRTPIHGVVGMLELLSDSELSREQRDFVDTAQGSAQMLLSVINDILDFSKSEAGKLSLENIDFNLHQVVEDVTATLAVNKQSDKVDVACIIDPQVPETVSGDPVRVRQLLTNLISNALKFTENGQVLVSVKKPEGLKDDTLCYFEVKDTGIGLSKEQQCNLFSAFTQADASVTRQYGGTGLGLAICSQLTELMGGKIGVESALRKGSRFWFTVKFGQVRQSTERPNLKGLRVLVVDDNTTNRKILERFLAGWQSKYRSVAGGWEAIGALREADAQGLPYQLAIIDWRMPGMDGMELTRTIRADQTICNLPIIMLSSINEVPPKTDTYGVDHAISKPIRQMQLLSAIEHIIHPADTGQFRRPILKKPLIGRLKGRVLLVDDNKSNRMIALAMLNKLGLETDVAENGRDAVDAVKSNEYDAVLMDVQMPIMGGLEASRAIRALSDPDRSDLPIIAMTANAMTGDKEECLAAGMSDYLAKPVRRAKLEETLTHWIGKDAKSKLPDASEGLQTSA